MVLRVLPKLTQSGVGRQMGHLLSTVLYCSIIRIPNYQCDGCTSSTTTTTFSNPPSPFLPTSYTGSLFQDLNLGSSMQMYQQMCWKHWRFHPFTSLWEPSLFVCHLPYIAFDQRNRRSRFECDLTALVHSSYPRYLGPNLS